MIKPLSQSAWLWSWGIVLLQALSSAPALKAQCDFISDITGLSLSVPPSSNSALYTQVYVLTNAQNVIVATSSSPDFLGLNAGSYYLYAVNYLNTEAAAVTPLLALGQAWSGITAYGDDSANCLDYTAQPYSNCLISLCAERQVCEYVSFDQVATGYNTSGSYTQVYLLVINGVVEAIQATGTFDLTAYPNATTGASAQVFALNYRTADGAPVAVGDTWASLRADLCAGACFDILGMDLDILPVSQPSGNGVSTTLDWWDTSDGCAGAQPASNGGAPVSVVVNNICVPSYSVGGIQARPLPEDDLERYMSFRPLASGLRVPCTGQMDLTQNPVFYTVECEPNGPSNLEIEVHDPGGAITRLEAALYGPVDPLCPVITGASFLDCEDAGAGSLSGDPIGTPLFLNADNVQPGQVYLVIVDSEGRDNFSITINSTLLAAKLSQFEAKLEGAHNLLTWEMEQDLAEGGYFVLERSVNGMAFSEIARIAGQNAGFRASSYSYLDQYPGTGLKYYRLRLHNPGGSTEYSRIRSLERNEVAPITGIAVYPNPSKARITIDYQLVEEATLTYELRDVLGRLLQNGQRAGQSGPNRFELDIANLPTAAYILSLEVNARREHRRIIKQ